MLLHQSFLETSARVPRDVALICAARRYTYAELAQSVENLAAVLQGNGVREGDRVAIFLENGAEAVVSLYAVLRIGAVFMLINPQTKTEKLAYTLADAGACCLISSQTLARVFVPALAQSAVIDTCVVVGGTIEAPLTRPVGVLDFTAATESAASDVNVREPKLSDQDLAALIYTSGSTGEPKGVMLSHRNMMTAASSVISYLGLVAQDVTLAALPLSFGYGLYQVLMSFRLGACVVLEPSFAFPVKVLETMAAERVTVFPGVPTMFNQILSLDDPSRYDLSSLRVVTNAAAALTVEQIQRIRAQFPHAEFFSMYGLTECKRVSYLPPDQLDSRPASVGRGMPNQECWLVNEHDERLPNGSTGELVVRGDHVMRGYWGKPQATAERLRPGPLPGEQLLYTGDIFRTDADGYLYFVARKDDIIKSRGEKVSPTEVERALLALAGVSEAAVIGVPDPALGEAIKAYVVVQPGMRYREKQVIRHCQGRLENFMVPKFVEFVEALPKTPNGKIDKLKLRERNARVASSAATGE